MVSNAWINMIADLDPNGDKGRIEPEWPVYDTAAAGGVGQNMVFAANGSFIEYDDFRAEALQWFFEHFLDVWGT